MKERVRGNPEVEEAAIVTAAPLGGRRFQTAYDDTPGIDTFSQAVDPEYFAAMRIPLDRGPAVWSRRREDRDRQPPAGARNVRHARCPGARLPEVGGAKAEATIIGVAADAHSIKIGANNVVELYMPLKPEDFSEVFLVARARSDADRLPPILREAAMIDPASFRPHARCRMISIGRCRDRVWRARSRPASAC